MMAREVALSFMWFVYIIRTKKNRFYTGITKDVKRRFSEHMQGPKARGAKFFLSDKPMEIVYQESFPDRSSASKEEARIKKMTRKEKENLVKGK